MTADVIRAWLNREPFRPFALVMNDGRRLEVSDPRHLFMPPVWRNTAIVWPPGRTFDFVHLPYVTGIDGGTE